MQFTKKVTLVSALINEIQHLVTPWSCKDMAWESLVSLGSSNGPVQVLPTFPGLCEQHWHSLVLSRTFPCASGTSQPPAVGRALLANVWVLHPWVTGLGLWWGRDAYAVYEPQQKVIYNPICYNHQKTSSLTGRRAFTCQNPPVGNISR